MKVPDDVMYFIILVLILLPLIFNIGANIDENNISEYHEIERCVYDSWNNVSEILYIDIEEKFIEVEGNVCNNYPKYVELNGDGEYVGTYKENPEAE